MWTGTIDPASRRQLKREELLGRYTERVHIDQDSNSDTSNTETLYIIFGDNFSVVEFVEMKNDVEMKLKEQQEAETTRSKQKPMLVTTIAKLVEDCAIDQVDNDVVYGSITGLVVAEIDFGGEKPVNHNLPTYVRNNPFDDIKQRATCCSAIYVGRVVESELDKTIDDLVYKAIVILGISRDVEILNHVSDSITKSITEKIYDSIEDSGQDVVETMHEEVAEVKSKLVCDAKSTAVRIVDAVALAVDDIITHTFVDAFKRLDPMTDVDGLTIIVAGMEL